MPVITSYSIHYTKLYEEGILFLDELNSAPPAVQASAYQLILDRRVGEYELPQGWAIVAAGNREDDRGVVYKMPSPLANRFVHLHMGVEVGSWREWAFKNGIDMRIVGVITSYSIHYTKLYDPPTRPPSRWPGGRRMRRATSTRWASCCTSC